MKIVKCEKNIHFYDADVYSKCPHCFPGIGEGIRPAPEVSFRDSYGGGIEDRNPIAEMNTDPRFAAFEKESVGTTKNENKYTETFSVFLKNEKNPGVESIETTYAQPASQPVRPAVPVMPAYTQPAAQPAMPTAPEMPAYAQPATPVYTQPAAQPATPVYTQPAAQPATPVYTQPAAQPATPVYTQPAAQPARPSANAARSAYAQPAAPVNPSNLQPTSAPKKAGNAKNKKEKTKKDETSGKGDKGKIIAIIAALVAVAAIAVVLFFVLGDKKNNNDPSGIPDTSDSVTDSAEAVPEADSPVNVRDLYIYNTYGSWLREFQRLEDGLGNTYYDAVNYFIPGFDAYGEYHVTGYTRVTGTVSSLYKTPDDKEAVFHIYANDVEIYASPVITNKSQPVKFDVAIPEGTTSIKFMNTVNTHGNSEILVTDLLLWK